MFEKSRGDGYWTNHLKFKDYLSKIYLVFCSGILKLKLFKLTIHIFLILPNYIYIDITTYNTVSNTTHLNQKNIK